MDLRVKFFEKHNGVEIFVAPILIGNPFSLFSGVVEIQHGGDGIDAQAVDMIAIEPEERAVEKKFPHFDSAELKMRLCHSG